MGFNGQGKKEVKKKKSYDDHIMRDEAMMSSSYTPRTNCNAHAPVLVPNTARVTGIKPCPPRSRGS